MPSPNVRDAKIIRAWFTSLVISHVRSGGLEELPVLPSNRRPTTNLFPRRPRNSLLRCAASDCRSNLRSLRGYCTVNVTLVECCEAPDVPVTVMV